jgi:hypothetical protein
MRGDERARLCAQCDKHVFNVSELTRAEAEALIVEKAGSLCVRYFQRKDGTILLADCEIGKRGVRRRRVIAAGVVAAMAAGGGSVYAMQEDEAKRKEELIAVAGGPMKDPYPYVEPPPVPRAPARECYAFRDEIFAVDDCISAAMRAHFRGVFVDALAQSTFDDEAQRKQAVETCVNGAETMRGLAKLCVKQR